MHTALVVALAIVVLVLPVALWYYRRDPDLPAGKPKGGIKGDHPKPR